MFFKKKYNNMAIQPSLKYELNEIDIIILAVYAGKYAFHILSIYGSGLFFAKFVPDFFMLIERSINGYKTPQIILSLMPYLSMFFGFGLSTALEISTIKISSLMSKGLGYFLSGSILFFFQIFSAVMGYSNFLISASIPDSLIDKKTTILKDIKENNKFIFKLQDEINRIELGKYTPPKEVLMTFNDDSGIDILEENIEKLKEQKNKLINIDVIEEVANKYKIKYEKAKIKYRTLIKIKQKALDNKIKNIENEILKLQVKLNKLKSIRKPMTLQEYIEKNRKIIDKYKDKVEVLRKKLKDTEDEIKKIKDNAVNEKTIKYIIYYSLAVLLLQIGFEWILRKEKRKKYFILEEATRKHKNNIRYRLQKEKTNEVEENIFENLSNDAKKLLEFYINFFKDNKRLPLNSEIKGLSKQKMLEAKKELIEKNIITVVRNNTIPSKKFLDAIKR